MAVTVYEWPIRPSIDDVIGRPEDSRYSLKVAGATYSDGMGIVVIGSIFPDHDEMLRFGEVEAEKSEDGRRECGGGHLFFKSDGFDGPSGRSSTLGGTLPEGLHEAARAYLADRWRKLKSR